MNKKTLIIIAVVFLGSFSVTYFLLKKNKTTTAIKIANHIPINNGLIGAINYTAIEEIVQTEMFRSPLELLAMKNNFKGNQFVSDVMVSLIQGGIDKEQKIIFYTPKGTRKGSYLLIAVDDYKRIKKKITERLGNYTQNKLNLSKDTYGNFYPKENVGIVLNKDFLLIATTEEQKVVALWGKIKTKTNCYPANSQKINSLINNDNHISIWTDNNSLTSSLDNPKEEITVFVNFLDGKLTVKANLTSDITFLSNKTVNTYSCDTCALSFHLNATNLSSISTLLNDSILQKVDSLTQLLNIDVKQFLELSNGKMNGIVIGTGKREDKIITYEFDDDFNKVKQEKIISVPVIDFILSIGTDKGMMYQQFKKQGIIKQKNKEELFTNPIGKCYVELNNQEMILQSNQLQHLERDKVDSNGFYFFADLIKLGTLFPKKKHENMKVFKSFRLEGNQKDSVITININVTSKNIEKNILFDLIGFAEAPKN